MSYKPLFLDEYFSVLSTGEAVGFNTTTNSDNVAFYLKKVINERYGYGDHATYSIINKDKEVDVYRVGEYALVGFETFGVQRNFLLRINYLHKGEQKSYILHQEGGLFKIKNLPQLFDDEWDIRQPSKTVIRFLLDCSSMGDQNRALLDETKRELFSTRIALSKKENELLALKEELEKYQNKQAPLACSEDNNN